MVGSRNQAQDSLSEEGVSKTKLPPAKAEKQKPKAGDKDDSEDSSDDDANSITSSMSSSSSERSAMLLKSKKQKEKVGDGNTSNLDGSNVS
jgi:hypothetical protein